ncbi:hypothetical protein OR263_02510 [Streptomyces sp. NEAU-H22]|uniref:hypothetical protein n=1 Tax=unclassified Streptomyces TaxID=2593676 RepID=UPI002257FCC6|nr:MULTISPECIES: hypothetical protein [unclassified Streptomyces]MCX3285610.1 hypothetical protein [Streptomyces sp. NEAU-H22]WMD03569.1 hypothetical protein Q7C01_03860 [Streptomyces sp. FXY-T5]
MALTRSLACGDGRVPSARAERMARAVFAALGGIVEIGTVRSTGTWLLPDVSVGAFLEPRQEDLGRLMEGVRVVGRFSGEVMAIADALGYFADHEVPAASLLLWSEGITGVPEPPERLEEPELVRRMCRIGADLQLTRLLQALVSAALDAGTESGEGAAGIAEILRVACGLAEPCRAGITPADVHRMWRVAHLPAILRPASDAPDWGKAGYRAYDAELERLLQGEGPGAVRACV